MPRLTATERNTEQTVQFVVSPTLDMMNLMYFTSLAAELEGVDGRPEELRREMSPELLKELDFLYNYPAGDPGLLGTLLDLLFVQPQTWRGVDALVAFVRGMPDAGESDVSPGIQRLVWETTFRYVEEPERAPYMDLPPREAIDRRLRSLDDRDAEAIMPLYDNPAELRERMARLVERFYEEHYSKEIAERMRTLEQSAAAHRNEPAGDPVELSARLTRRERSCLEGSCAGDYRRFIFSPSTDMGAYNNCIIIDGIHAWFYQLEPEFRAGASVEAEEQARLARLFKALGDEQRLRILGFLREREMYAQEIVERAGLHQSVVSRHLSFLKAVGLVTARRENNMKFYSINPKAREDLGKSFDLLVPGVEAGTAYR